MDVRLKKSAPTPSKATRGQILPWTSHLEHLALFFFLLLPYKTFLLEKEHETRYSHATDTNVVLKKSRKLVNQHKIMTEAKSNNRGRSGDRLHHC